MALADLSGITTNALTLVGNLRGLLPSLPGLVTNIPISLAPLQKGYIWTPEPLSTLGALD